MKSVLFKYGVQLFFGIVLLAGRLPVTAQDDRDTEPLPEGDTILGTWYIQVMEGEVTEDPMRLVFNEDGTVLVSEDGVEEEEEESGQYSHDENQSKITIYENGRVEAVIQYSFVDEMLVFKISDGARGHEEERFELTRHPDGTKRHQAVREKRGDGDPAVQARRRSMTQLRGLHQGAVVYANSRKAVMPESIGDMVVGDYIPPTYVIPPWSEAEVPEGFDDWEDQKKRDWTNRNSGYVYLRSEKKLTLDAELIAFFELPASVEQEQVNLLFDDNHIESHPFAEADKLIKKQTGYTIKQWMKTTSPGTGQMVLPEGVVEEEEGN